MFILKYDIDKIYYSLSFHVLGDRNVVYICTLKLAHKPTCTCPHFVIRKAICKHLKFIDDFVLCRKWFPLTPSIFSPATYDYEKIDIHISERLKSIGASETICDVYKQHLNKSQDSNNISNKKNRNTECAICLESFCDETPIKTCNVCFNGAHSQCWEKWKKKQCIYCRSPDFELKDSVWGLYLSMPTL